MSTTGVLAERYLELLLANDRHAASNLIMEAVDNGHGIKQVYLDVFQRTQHEIGRLWQNNQVTVAQEHYCTAVTQMVMSQLYPRIFTTAKHGHSMVATCVGGELHEIGIRMVSDFFELEGWDTYYLGANAPAFTVIETIRDRQPDILALSVSMSFNLPAAKELLAELRSAGLPSRTKLLVGGRPFNVSAGLWEELGADLYAADAQGAVDVASEAVGVRR